MSSTTPAPPPAVAGVRGAAAALTAVAEECLVGCGQDDLIALLDGLTELAARTAGLTTATVGELAERGVTVGSVSVGPVALLRDRYQISHRAARAQVEHAFAVRHCFPTILAGQRAGRVSAEQAATIVTGLDRLPPTSTPTERGAAQATMVDLAATLDPVGLRNAANRIVEQLTVVSADGDEPADGPDEHDLRSLTVWRRDGGLAGRFTLPGLDGETFATWLAARAVPDSTNHGDASDPDGRDLRSTAQRNADALLDAIRHTSGCTAAAGAPVPTVVVTMDLRWLTGQLSTHRPALLDSGRPLSATDARMAACAEAVIPMVLSTAGEVLDVGRAARLHTTPMRRAITVRDKGCVFPGCEQPPAACHLHHLTKSWADGGPTNARTGALLCPHHHRQVHRHRWTGQLDARGLPQLVPPPGSTRSSTPASTTASPHGNEPMPDTV